MKYGGEGKDKNLSVKVYLIMIIKLKEHGEFIQTIKK